jgi:hypothetical protein
VFTIDDVDGVGELRENTCISSVKRLRFVAGLEYVHVVRGYRGP